MTFEETLDHAIATLQRRGRLAYGTLKRQFQLDDAAPEDLKNELIEGLDPGAAQQLFDPAIRLMMGAVHRFEGTANQVLGDGMMARLAHEAARLQGDDRWAGSRAGLCWPVLPYRWRDAARYPATPYPPS